MRTLIPAHCQLTGVEETVVAGRAVVAVALGLVPHPNFINFIKYFNVIFFKKNITAGSGAIFVVYFCLLIFF